ncbi:MAG: Asp-tRNA(Asn)/Glu-tRNA(Gln) amidotransferase subunit GatA [Patescibacteria group bacterium]
MTENLTIKKFHDGLAKKKFSAIEVAKDYFSRIKSADGKLGAYLSLNEERALADAEALDFAIGEGENIGLLAGVPLAVKDNILIKGLPATAASKILEYYRASYDAEVVRKLRNEHAIFIGKTNMDEFAMGASTENSAFKIARNPHDHTRVPGGSSGGSAAAVAADLAIAALGSDTGGSIRQPASFCGVVGLKPTYGAVSRSGLIAMASSMDQIGPITKTVEDAAILFRAITGKDRLDATSAETEFEDFENTSPETLRALTIGLPGEYFAGGLSKEVSSEIERVIEKFKALKFMFKKISLPHAKYAIPCYYLSMPAEVSSNLARFEGIRYGRNENLKSQTSPNGHSSGRISNLQEIYFKQRGAGFGPEVKRRIILGTFVLSSGYYDAYYEKAQRARMLIKQDFDEAFADVDVILSPVAPTTAFKIGEKIDDPLAMYLSDVFTGSVNLAGLPAISIPTKPSSALATKELPVGFQLIGKHFREADILGLGKLYERTFL